MDDRKRLLIVDDEAGFTGILKRSLEETGRFEVRTEHEGARAVEAARRFRPDLVLLDILMPDVDGGEIAAQMRADPTLAEIPVVYLTAIVSKRDLQAQSKLIRGNVFVAKPVRKEVLVEIIEKELARAER